MTISEQFDAKHTCAIDIKSCQFIGLSITNKMESSFIGDHKFRNKRKKISYLPVKKFQTYNSKIYEVIQYFWLEIRSGKLLVCEGLLIIFIILNKVYRGSIKENVKLIKLSWYYNLTDSMLIFLSEGSSISDVSSSLFRSSLLFGVEFPCRPLILLPNGISLLLPRMLRLLLNKNVGKILREVIFKTIHR